MWLWVHDQYRSVRKFNFSTPSPTRSLRTSTHTRRGGGGERERDFIAAALMKSNPLLGGSDPLSGLSFSTGSPKATGAPRKVSISASPRTHGAPASSSPRATGSKQPGITLQSLGVEGASLPSPAQVSDDWAAAGAAFVVPAGSSGRSAAPPALPAPEAPLDLDALLSGTTSTLRPLPQLQGSSTASDAASKNGGSSPPRGSQRATGMRGSSLERRKSVQARTAPKSKYHPSGELCWDHVTSAHCWCFPCAADALYTSMNDPGFSCCSVTVQMVALFPLWPFLCCVQAHILRDKFNSIIDEKEDRAEICCSSCMCPCVLTAQIHREMELRHRAVHTKTCCSGPTRLYLAERDAMALPRSRGNPSVGDSPSPSTMGEGGVLAWGSDRPPFLEKSSPFGGARLSESVENAVAPATVIAGELKLPIIDRCCGHAVVYNSWRHGALLGLSLLADPLWALLEVVGKCCGS